jgi:hypothetical protein
MKKFYEKGNAMKKKAFIWIVLILIVSTIFVISSGWIEEKKNEALRKQLISSVEKRKSCDGKIMVSEILPPQYSELCFQPAYMNKFDFEKRTKKSVKGYEILQHDGAGAWWFFEKDGSQRKLLIAPTGKGESPDIAAGLCFSKDDTSLAVDCNVNIFYTKKVKK